MKAKGICSDLCDKLNELRVSRNWTLAQAAEKTGLSVSTISNYENNRSEPTVESLIALSKAYDIPLEEFFKVEWSEYDNDLAIFKRYGFSDAFFQTLFLSRKMNDKSMVECLNYLLDDPIFAYCSLFEELLQAFNIENHRKINELSISLPYDASFRCLLEPAIQTLYMIFEAKQKKEANLQEEMEI